MRNSYLRLLKNFIQERLLPTIPEKLIHSPGNASSRGDVWERGGGEGELSRCYVNSLLVTVESKILIYDFELNVLKAFRKKFNSQAFDRGYTKNGQCSFICTKKGSHYVQYFSSCSAALKRKNVQK